MGKPILDRLKRWDYWYADQLPHALVGAAIMAGVSCGLTFGLDNFNAAASVTLGFFASNAVTIVRELMQNWRDEPEEGSTEDTAIDIGFWHVGSCLGSLPVILI